MKTYIYFVRHGIAPFSLEKERDRGANLNGQGQRDAIRVAELLKEEQIDVIVSSAYHRARETVAPLAERLGMDITLYEELIERPIAGLHQGYPEEELLAAIERSFRDPDYRMPDGESTRQAQERAIPILLKLLSDYKGRKIAVGTHGNIMTIMLSYFDPSYGYEFWKSTSKPDIYRAEFHDTQLLQVERLWKPD